MNKNERNLCFQEKSLKWLKWSTHFQAHHRNVSAFVHRLYMLTNNNYDIKIQYFNNFSIKSTFFLISAYGTSDQVFLNCILLYIFKKFQ